MRKISFACLFAASLLTVNQFAAADSSDAAKVCPSLSEIQTLPLRQVSYDSYRDVSTVSTSYQHKDNALIPYQYMFSVEGVKGVDADDVIKKVQNALAIAVNTNPAAISINHGYASSTCTYSLDFSTSADNYNGNYPTATVEIRSL